MKKSFGELLREKLKAADNMKPAQLGRISGVSKQNIGRILNQTPHPISGALPTVERETVQKIANALKWNLDEALVAAGFAPNDISGLLTDSESQKLLKYFEQMNSVTQKLFLQIGQTFVGHSSDLNELLKDQIQIQPSLTLPDDEDDQEISDQQNDARKAN